jgi:hypothetical protein
MAQDYTLYQWMHDGYGNHSLIVDVKGNGFQTYAFTFVSLLSDIGNLARFQY